MREICKDCGNDTFIQNSRGQCGECVYKKNHRGKSRQEVYSERDKSKKIVTKKVYGLIGGDEVGFMNRIAQDLAEEREKRDQEEFEKKKVRFYATKKIKGEKKKSIKKVSIKQSIIEREYKKTCIDMDYTEEKVCSGCLRYQGGDIKLSHSHIISRADCKRIGRPELIYERDNIHYHCLDFGENTGCHRKWESPVERVTLIDYEENIEYIKSISEKLYQRYISK